MCVFFFFFKQKTAYEMRISDWSSDVCSSDLHGLLPHVRQARRLANAFYGEGARLTLWDRIVMARLLARDGWGRERRRLLRFAFYLRSHWLRMPPAKLARHLFAKWRRGHRRSEEHTSELQSLMRISDAVLCLK